MNESNLIPFRKGKSGNPSGRPRGSKNVSTQLKKLIGKAAPEDVANSKIIADFAGHLKRPTMADAIAVRLLSEAVKGNIKAIKEINDRLEGKARQAVEVSGSEGGPLVIEYVNDWRNANESD